MTATEPTGEGTFGAGIESPIWGFLTAGAATGGDPACGAAAGGAATCGVATCGASGELDSVSDMGHSSHGAIALTCGDGFRIGTTPCVRLSFVNMNGFQRSTQRACWV
ncbi:MAG: hypothetical protein F2809_02780 [Actinobacteria bacterium]|nr:hypothetical protein [Actinomycetota bacterium]